MAARVRKLIEGIGLEGPAVSFKHGLVSRRDARPIGLPARAPAGGAARAPRTNPFQLLGGAVGHLLRFPVSLRYFARGRRYVEGLAPASPQAASANAPAQAAGPLEEYFNAHNEGLAMYKRRHYLPIYERHLERFRGRPLTLVEVGVSGGGSLEMWREYLGPQAHIFGIDIDPACRKHEREGIEVVIGDQASREFWAGFLERVPAPDIVLDDGGHKPDQMTVTLECVLPHIRPGGLYLCEDIGGSFQPFQSFLDALTRPLSAIPLPGKRIPTSPLQQHVASVHRYPMVAVIEKPPGPVEFPVAARGRAQR